MKQITYLCVGVLLACLSLPCFAEEKVQSDNLNHFRDLEVQNIIVDRTIKATKKADTEKVDKLKLAPNENTEPKSMNQHVFEKNHVKILDPFSLNTQQCVLVLNIDAMKATGQNNRPASCLDQRRLKR